MLSEFDQRRLFDICQAVKQLSEDGNLISVFGERLVNHVNHMYIGITMSSETETDKKKFFNYLITILFG